MISRQRNGVALAPLAWNLCDLAKASAAAFSLHTGFEANTMLALFLDHPPLFVAGEIALGLSLALFVGALIAAVISGVPEGLSVARTWPSKSNDCSTVCGRSGARPQRCFVGGSGNDAVGSIQAALRQQGV
jgi:hypothetical protein